jgi:hypothetical protein
MKIMIEFYRTRAEDDAQAVVGREMALAADLDDAIGIARLLATTLEMPQQPDAVLITGADGAMLYRGAIAAQAGGQGQVG